MSLDKIKIQQTAQNLIGHFDSEAKVEIVLKDNNCSVGVESEMSGLLIGRSGETLDALQHLLRLILAQETGEYFPVLLDISGYRALRAKELEEEIKVLARKVSKTGESVDLEPMSSFERRLVHLIIEDIEGVETESVGEGTERRIVIKKSQ